MVQVSHFVEDLVATSRSCMYFCDDRKFKMAAMHRHSFNIGSYGKMLKNYSSETSEPNFVCSWLVYFPDGMFVEAI